MNKKKILIIIGVIVIILGVLVINAKITGNSVFSMFSGSEEKQINEGKTVQMTVTKENLGLYFEQQEIVKDLPKDAVIGFAFYSFSNGERVWEEKYTIRKGSVVKKDYSNENPDMIIYMHSRNFNLFGDVCNAVKTANKNGDLGYDIKISKASLLWKYKKMMGYRECFGM